MAPRVPRWPAGPVARWRRSVQLRIVATTLVVSFAIVTVLGAALLGQVAHGLLTAKRRSALAEADAGLFYAQAQLAQSDVGNQPDGIDPLLEGITSTLDGRGNGIYYVGLLPTSATASGYYDKDNFDPADVPAALRRAVVRRQVLASTYVSAAPNGVQQPELLVGAPITAPTGDSYQLYFAFPLQEEAQTLNLVRGTLFVGGLALVLLVAGLVAFVTRQVVTPVRLAAQVADQFAAGRLSVRVRVHGQDELARLGRAFNAMAAGLQGQIRQLEELSRVQQRFTADVSHELRTPLTTIRMAVDVLHEARGAFPPEVARSAELLLGELDRFELLLADLLEISRYDAGAVVLEPETVDLAALVRVEAGLLAGLAQRRGSALDLRGVPAHQVLVEVDPRRVRRIVRNLVTNAVEYGEGGPVLLDLRADAAAVAFRVRDRGVGLRPGEAALVFSRFWRSDPSRARLTGGTGLGLSIALEDARLHGGWLQAWGEPGRGAVFRLVLPLVAGGEVHGAPLPLDPAATDAEAPGATGPAAPDGGATGPAVRLAGEPGGIGAENAALLPVAPP